MATRKKSPLTRCSGTLTESGYLAWIRSALRAKSLKWKPRNDALLAARRPYKGTNKLQKWECQCSMCSGWFKLKEVVVDHHPHAAGSILSVADIGPFAERLYCEVDNLRVLCVECHRGHTLAELKGLTLKEAKLEIVVNDIMKDKKKTLDILQANGHTHCRNNEQRKQALLTILGAKND